MILVSRYGYGTMDTGLSRSGQARKILLVQVRLDQASAKNYDFNVTLPLTSPRGTKKIPRTKIYYGRAPPISMYDRI